MGDNDVEVRVAVADGHTRELKELGRVWSGERPPEYRDCVDVDLSFTPIHVAWLVWPELTVERVLQRYTRLAEDRYRYRQGEFEAELTVDRQASFSSTKDSGARSPSPRLGPPLAGGPVAAPQRWWRPAPEAQRIGRWPGSTASKHPGARMTT